ncbi:hypothetical protein AMTRI_Chr02g214350 [Amborella trichopoda]
MASRGLLVRVAEIILVPLFTFIAISVPVLNAQTVLPSSLFPQSFADLNSQYVTFSGDYLFTKKPHFFVEKFICSACMTCSYNVLYSLVFLVKGLLT